MSHARMYHFKYDDNVFEETDEDSVFEETEHFADYVEEMEIDDWEMQGLWEDLCRLFGEENIVRNGLSFTIKKSGALAYFERMRIDLLNAITASINQPIEQFIEIDLQHPGWWQLKQRIESDFNNHYSIDTESFQSPTRFAETIIEWCQTDKVDEITLELKQIFDFHF